MKYGINSIRNRWNSGEKLEFIFFWGHSAKPGQIKKACLSQWYPCEFTVDGVKYHTAEQFMMAQKALLFRDREAYEKIMAAETPKEYKALGRTIRNFDQKTWDDHKFDIVVRGNIAKFSQNDGLREYLEATGEKVLVEASPYDGIWGVKLDMEDPAIRDPNRWMGENLLGFALMEARDQLRADMAERA